MEAELAYPITNAVMIFIAYGSYQYYRICNFHRNRTRNRTGDITRRTALARDVVSLQTSLALLIAGRAATVTTILLSFATLLIPGVVYGATGYRDWLAVSNFVSVATVIVMGVIL